MKARANAGGARTQKGRSNNVTRRKKSGIRAKDQSNGLREEGTRARKQENKSKKSDSNDPHDLSRLFKIQGYGLCLLVNRLLRQVLVLARVPPDEHDAVICPARVGNIGAALREHERVAIEFVIVFAVRRKSPPSHQTEAA